MPYILLPEFDIENPKKERSDGGGENDSSSTGWIGFGRVTNFMKTDLS